MTDEKVYIPYKVQKGNRPKMEEVVNYCLDGELKKSAYDFVMFMRDNKMPFRITSSCTRGQNAKYGGYEVCSIMAMESGGDFRPPDELQWWRISPKLYNINKYDDLAITEGFTIPWEVTRYCCYKDKPEDWVDGGAICSKCKRITNRTIFGIEYNGLCHHYWPEFYNPDKATIKSIKRLLELEKMARDGLI